MGGKRNNNNDFEPIRTPENPAARRIHKQHLRLQKLLFCSRYPMYLPAAMINSKGTMSHIPMVQPTEHPRISPP